MKFAVQHQVDHAWEAVAEYDSFDAAVLRAQADRSDGIDARVRSPEQRTRDEAARNISCSKCGRRGHVWCGSAEPMQHQADKPAGIIERHTFAGGVHRVTVERR